MEIVHDTVLAHAVLYEGRKLFCSRYCTCFQCLVSISTRIASTTTVTVQRRICNDDNVFCIREDIGDVGRCNLVVLSSGDDNRSCNQGVAIRRCV